MNISIPLFSLARDFAHLARPQVRDEHSRTFVRRASSTGREHSQGAKLPLSMQNKPNFGKDGTAPTSLLLTTNNQRLATREAQNKPNFIHQLRYVADRWPMDYNP